MDKEKRAETKMVIKMELRVRMKIRFETALKNRDTWTTQ